jgi:sulfotransferase family protein
MRVLPDYVVVGTQKSGTSYVGQGLAQHPAIVPASRSEVHYFDWHFPRGDAWYRAHFPTRLTRERMLRQRGEFACGEVTPSYLFAPVVAPRIAALLPDAKFIVMLRNPVDRLLSQYHHDVRRGKQARSLDAAIAHGLAQLHAWPHYLGRSLYAGQLERWFHVFDRSQIHVMISERMFADPVRAICELHEFIGLTPVAPEPARNWGVRYPPMADELRDRLQDFFAEDVARLAELLGADPGWW